MTINDKKDIQDALNIISEMLDKEIIDDTPIPTNFIHKPSYNKAIDDFAEKIVINSNRLNVDTDDFEEFGDNVANVVYGLAEQLKAGGENV